MLLSCISESSKIYNTTIHSVHFSKHSFFYHEFTNKLHQFQVHRRGPELIVPAKPTPYEFKLLSDIDDQEGLRFHVPIVQIYHHDPSVQGKDPVKVIREALAKALVFYYLFAGSLREWSNRKLVVECPSEGVLFIEADADITLEHCRDALQTMHRIFINNSYLDLAEIL
ncbi:hypothetical protein RCOM_1516910 [Ricinus communis]|uniref:Uncharacterized protein n=1 Tax=Ricinus communis TaxID=3988 RepID=B9SDE4_RICCO|nr:hypothetical protein RCOM_1516910 [Ricinus communis]